MSESYIFEGKTTQEAIEKGLKNLKTTKDKVEVKVLESDKRSFFDILAPRIVKIEMSFKKQEEKIRKKQIISDVQIKKQEENVKVFLDEFFKKLKIENIIYKTEISDSCINIDIRGEELNYLIGYRGEVLNALQTIIASVSAKNFETKARVSLNIEGYREKREKALEELADKISKTVIKTKKSVTLEPMSPYERKIIHSRLQNNDKVNTHSIGEEPYRKVVITLK